MLVLNGFVALFGLVIGSFLNVVIYRLPLGVSIVKPRSRCGACQHTLNGFDLVPVLSFLFLKGKCRYCATKISWRYPSIELLNAVLYLGVFSVYGFTIQAMILMALSSMLICIAMIDFDHSIIPNALNIGVAVLAVANCATGGLSIKGAIWGFAIGAGVMLAIMAVGALFKVQAMGGGDLKLMAAVGPLIGPVAVIFSYLVAFVFGGLVTLVLLLTGKKKMTDGIPFGPFLAIGIYLSSLFYLEWIRILSLQ